MGRTRAVSVEAATEEGYPVEVRVPYDDGPLIITDVHAGTALHFEVESGRTSASTRARLDALLSLGGTPVLVTPSAEGGSTAADTGGTES